MIGAGSDGREGRPSFAGSRSPTELSIATGPMYYLKALSAGLAREGRKPSIEPVVAACSWRTHCDALGRFGLTPACRATPHIGLSGKG